MVSPARSSARCPALRAEDRLHPGGNPGPVPRRNCRHRGGQAGHGQVAPEPGARPAAFLFPADRGATLMHPDDLFETWKRRRSRTDESAAFVDRVMDAVRRENARRLLLAGWLAVVLRSRAFHVGVGTVACAAFLLRVLLLVGLFLGPSVQ